MKAILYALMLLITVKAFSQERVDEKLPELNEIPKSLINPTGWKKNDTGKWVKAFDKPPIDGQILRIETSYISYKGQVYFSIATFNKHSFIKYGEFVIEYYSDFWLIDTSSIKTYSYGDSVVKTLVFDNVVQSFLSKDSPVTWKDICLQTKKCFNGSGANNTFIYDRFFLKFRKYSNEKTVHFFLGSTNQTFLNDPDLIDFTNSATSCQDVDRNKNLGCCYYEVRDTLFEGLFRTLLK